LHGCQVPIILLIEPEVEVETEALQAGAADCLIKGQFDSRLLQRSICYAIERQKILRSLKESESRLESILSLRQEVVWSIAATTMNTLYISPAAQTVYGHAVAEFFDNPNLWLEVVHPSDRQAAINFSQSCLQPGSKDLEYRIIRPDGEVRWIHNQAHLVGDPVARRIDGIATDITDRKQVEAETQKFVALVENSSDFIAMSSPEGKVLYLNAAGCQLVGLNSSQEAVSKDMADYLFEDGLRQFCEMTLPQLMANEHCEGEAQLRHFQTGKPIDVQRSCFCIRSPTGELLSFATVQRDITQRKADEETLRLLASAVNQANESILITTADLDLPGPQITFVNPAFTKSTGYTASEVIGKTPRLLQGAKTDRAELKRLRQCLSQGKEFFGESINYRKDGTEFYLEWHVAPIKNERQKITHFVSIQRDITERKQVQKQLLYHAFYDAVTGLPNRTFFMARLEDAIALAQQQNYLFAVLFLDLDRFKVINDSLGHLIGDRLLMATAQKLKSCVSSEDTVARFGGDEFAILLENVRHQDVVLVAERIKAELASPFNLDGQEVVTTATIGIALSVTGYDQAEDLLRNADTAMYQAKAQGKARHEVFNPSMYTCAVTLMQLETDLRRALQRQEFQLYYQPIMSLKTNKLAGFEALVRWQHPERGLVSPAEFIPLAEETGLIVPLGLWVIQEACRQMHVWQQQFPVPSAQSHGSILPLAISVNISARQFSQVGLTQEIQKILAEFELDASNLKLEITESVLMQNAEVANKMLQHLKTLGVQLSIDDFGTGYSSLSYLHRFPIGMLKVDRSFINRMDTDKESIEIIWTIITLAHNLGMKVVAEGVETVGQLAKLKALQCEYGQGYFFSRPLNSDAAGVFIHNNRQFTPKTY